MTDDEIDDLLDGLSRQPVARMLLEHSVGRILRRDARKGLLPAHFQEDLRHVADWLIAADLSDVFWIGRTDPSGRPVKLMKLGSIAACVAEADKAMRLASSRNTPTGLGPGDEEVEWDCGEGWSMVRLLTPAALDLESSRMGHCIGNGAYDRSLALTDTCYLSLRGPNGQPHATLHLSMQGKNRPALRQSQGRGNRRPVVAHRVRIAAFLLAYGIDIPEDDYGGMLIDEDGRIRDASDPSITIGKRTGTLSLAGNRARLLKDGTRIEGSLSISGSDIERFPADIYVRDHVTIADCPSLKIDSLAGFKGTGDVVIESCGSETFVFDGADRKLHLEGLVDASGNRRLRQVTIGPGGAERTADILNAGHVAIATDKLAHLELNDCAGIAFPERFSSGFISIAHSKVDVWPTALSASSFNCFSVGLVKLPAFARMPRKVSISKEPDFEVLDGNIGRKTRVTVLKSGLRRLANPVRRLASLTILDCPLEQLPDDLHLEGGITLENLPLETLPSGLRINAHSVFKNLRIDRLPADMMIGWRIDIIGCPLDDSFPGGKVFKHDLHLVDCGLKSLPEGFTVHGDLHLTGNPISELPSGMRIDGNLDLSGTSVTRLPSDMVVRGMVTFDPYRIDRPDVEIRMVDPSAPHASTRGLDRGPWRNLRNRLEFLMLRRRPFSGVRENEMGCRGIIVDSEGLAHSPEHLPARLNVAGDLHVMSERLGIPDGMVVDGTFRISNCTINRFGAGLKVGGDFSFWGWDCRFRSNEEKTIAAFEAGGNVEFGNIQGIFFLPEYLHVRGDLTIDMSPDIRLPRRLIVDGDLVMSANYLGGYEGEAKIGGDVRIGSGDDRTIPEGMEVGGSVRLSAGRTLFGPLYRLLDFELPTTTEFAASCRKVLGIKPRPNFIEILRPSPEDVPSGRIMAAESGRP